MLMTVAVATTESTPTTRPVLLHDWYSNFNAFNEKAIENSVDDLHKATLE